MSDKIRFTIDEDLTEAVGTLVSAEKSPISLLRGSGKPVNDGMLTRLRSLGITDATGKLLGEYQHAAETLAQTRQFSRLKFSGGEKIFEFIVYFPSDNSVPVSVVHNGNQLIVQEPAAFEEAFSLVEQNTGHSILSSCTFDGKFSPEEAEALFALLDLERSTLLSRLAEEQEPQNTTFSPAAVVKKITGRKEHFQSLEYVIQSRMPPTPPPDQHAVASVLEALAGKGLVVHQGRQYHLSDALYALAGRFLIIDNFVVIESGRLDEAGTLWGGSAIVLQAGVNDLLYIEVHGEEVIVKCITGFELMDLAGKFMSDPTLVTIPVSAAPATSAGAAGTKTCPKCGAPVKEGKKFCTNCGARIG